MSRFIRNKSGTNKNEIMPIVPTNKADKSENNDHLQVSTDKANLRGMSEYFDVMLW